MTREWRLNPETQLTTCPKNGVNFCQANLGLTQVDDIATQCAEMARVMVTTSTYGLGHGFNEDLMDAMAKAGQGQGYYGETAEDLMEPFQREFDLLDAMCAKRLRLTIEGAQGTQVEQLNDYPKEHDRLILPDLAYGSEAWAVIRLSFPSR